MIDDTLLKHIGVALRDLEVVAEMLAALRDNPDPRRVQPLALLALTRIEHAILALNLDQADVIPGRRTS